MRSFSCTDPQVASSGLAPCTAQLTLNTDWHKKSDVSSLALSFFTSTEEWGNNNLNDIRENFNIVASVITGTTGAWPSKVGAISNIGLTYVDNYEFPYILDIAYKVGACMNGRPVEWEWEWEWAKIIIISITHTPLSLHPTHTGARLEPRLLQVNCRSTWGSRSRQWSRSPILSCMASLRMASLQRSLPFPDPAGRGLILMHIIYQCP